MTAVKKKVVKDIRTLLQEQKRPERVVKIYLRGDLIADIDQLDVELQKLGQSLAAQGDSRLSGNSEAKRLGDQIQALRAEAEESSVSVRLQAMTRKAWNDLIAKHPGDKDKNEDFDARKLFDEAVPLSIVDPDLDADTMDKFLDALTEGQYDQLAGAVYVLNAGEGAVPFSVLASRALQPSEEASK